MNQRYVTALAVFCAFTFLFCKSKDNTPKKADPMKAESSLFSKKHCVNEANGQCAEFTISYPIFSGGDSVTVLMLNKSVQAYVLSAVAGNGQLPFAQALDSAGWQFIEQYTEALKETPDMPMGFSTEITDTIPFMNSKVVTIQMDGYAYTGGAHPNPFGLLVSYDLSNHVKPLEITDLVRDTNAVRPALEKAYKLSKGLKETDPLSEVTYPDLVQLPMPSSVGVATEGIRFFYNAYEVAPYAVGASDVLLTWEQLGALADRDRWMGDR